MNVEAEKERCVVHTQWTMEIQNSLSGKLYQWTQLRQKTIYAEITCADPMENKNKKHGAKVLIYAKHGYTMR